MTEKIDPVEFEKQLLEKELAVQEYDPLDVHAQLFHMFMPRFQGQLNFMSKKELLTLMDSLAGSDYNLPADLNKVRAMANGMNLKSLKRVLVSVIESPLAEDELKLLSEKERKLFLIFDSLLTNKYFNCIAKGLEKRDNEDVLKKELEEIIFHQIDTNSSNFKKRKPVEKDAFAVGNKLLACKYFMIMSIEQEYAEKQKVEEVKNEEENKII